MNPRGLGLGRLKAVADAAGRRVADSAGAVGQLVADTAGDVGQRVADVAGEVGQRVADAAGDAQDMVKRSAEQVKAKVEDVTAGLSAGSSREDADSTDLSTLSPEAKLLYCRTLVSLALVDTVLDPREIANLYLFASTIGLDGDARSALRGDITAAQRGAETPGTTEELARQLHELLADDRREPVFTMLIRDLVRISRADRHAADVERAQITLVAGLVFPASAGEVVHATERLVIAEEDFAAGKVTTSQMETTTKEIVAKVAAFGTPIAAVSLAGSVSGLGGAGITSGLAALGFGGLLGLSAMVTGIGTVVILGVVVHQGARYVLATNERERENRREFLIQQVIMCHQQAMAELTDDIAGLAHRLEAGLDQTVRNEERLITLKAELDAFQQALMSLQSSQEAFERREPLSVG
ncbi:TerB family tellurite resistance protein [Actinoplanes rectilineatus]|uniref:tellurite resistance TerB family protein n=1 Tax=Actinoplanes rectilineatus TaxID=113571 RepID=UPI0005F2F446|nr:TerB family tellurite resistance protein [Actinoplanes rectilineatus]